MLTAIYSDIPMRNRPSFYATPVAWASADFAQSLISDAGGIAPDHTGLIVVSDECSSSTIRELAKTAAQGAVSPLRFAGASPSIVAGLPALQQGIRGPTLTLTMPPQHAATAITALINCWIRHNNVVAVIVIAHYRQGEHRHAFNGFVATSADAELPQQLLQAPEGCSAPGSAS
jgi:hypothetical protein